MAQRLTMVISEPASLSSNFNILLKNAIADGWQIRTEGVQMIVAGTGSPWIFCVLNKDPS